jgi:tight adherence protein B
MGNYNNYKMTWKEKILSFIQGVLMIFVLGLLFYQSIYSVPILSPLVYLYQKRKKKNLIENRKWRLNQEFRDCIISLSAALNAGYSVENALEETRKDLSVLYKEDALIMQELFYMINQIRMNITVEKALFDFADRTGVEDIESFAEVFATAKRTGGDLIRVIKITTNTISDRIEVKREIVTLITAKKYESNIMKAIPPGIIIYLQLSSPRFLKPLYHNTAGVTIMTALLLVYLGAFLLADRIVAIEV